MQDTRKDEAAQTPSGAERTPYIPKPPSPADLDVVSQDQALITDEWAEPGPEEKSGDAPAP